MKLRSWIGGLLLATAGASAWISPAGADTGDRAMPVFTMSPVGWVRKSGDKTFNNPLRGVFATRSPYRPNLIALTEVDVIAVRDNLIEIDGIDAFADTPVLDLKP